MTTHPTAEQHERLLRAAAQLGAAAAEFMAQLAAAVQAAGQQLAALLAALQEAGLIDASGRPAADALARVNGEPECCSECREPHRDDVFGDTGTDPTASTGQLTSAFWHERKDMRTAHSDLRCCVCGTTDNGGRPLYENCQGQLFCWPCADGDRPNCPLGGACTGVDCSRRAEHGPRLSAIPNAT